MLLITLYSLLLRDHDHAAAARAPAAAVGTPAAPQRRCAQLAP
jgi:hypothetical protein